MALRFFNCDTILEITNMVSTVFDTYLLRNGEINSKKYFFFKLGAIILKKHFDNSEMT